jgi:hypothetical protein
MICAQERRAARPARSAPDEGHDLDHVTGVEAHAVVLGARDHAPVVLDGHARALQGELPQQVGDRAAVNARLFRSPSCSAATTGGTWSGR